MVTIWNCRACGSTNEAPAVVCLVCGTAKDAEAVTSARPVMDDQEWSTLLFAPLWVFSAVAGADGTLDEREVGALVKVIERSELVEAELLKDVLWDCAQDLDRLFGRYRADPRTVDAGLRDVRAILARRVSRARANEFTKGLVAIGTHFAEASGGGLLGIADKISEQERAALTVLESLLERPSEDEPERG